MSNKCDFKLAADLVAECANTSVAGVRNEGFIVNYDDIDFESCTRNTTNPNIIEQLVIKTGKKAYKMYVPGSTPYTGTNKAFVARTYRNAFTKQVKIVILNNGPEVSQNVIDQLANGSFVVVLENKFRGSEGKNTFEVYGFEQGLHATEMADDKYSEETDGGWSTILEETNAPTSGIYLYNQSVEATRTALETLVAGAE